MRKPYGVRVPGAPPPALCVATNTGMGRMLALPATLKRLTATGVEAEGDIV